MKNLKNYNQFVNEDVDITANDLKVPKDQQVQVGVPQSQVQTQPQVQQTQSPQMPVKPKELTLDKYRNMIDYTLLKETVSKETLSKFIEEGIQQQFYSICVLPKYVTDVEFVRDERDIKICATIDYPRGNSTENEKLTEAIEAMSDGADEIDMVMNYKDLKEAYINEDEEIKQSVYSKLEQEIRTVADECHKNAVILKVIVESELLTLEELSKACEIVANSGADFIQTSTGTHNKPVELVKVKEMRRLLPDYVKIKISGGVRTLQQCEDFYQYIDRIGTSVILK